MRRVMFVREASPHVVGHEEESNEQTRLLTWEELLYGYLCHVFHRKKPKHAQGKGKSGVENAQTAINTWDA